MATLREAFLTAFTAWAEEAGVVPHIWVEATAPNVIVPKEYVDPKHRGILLNISERALESPFFIENEKLFMVAFFNQRAAELVIPLSAIKFLVLPEYSFCIPLLPEGNEPKLAKGETPSIAHNASTKGDDLFKRIK